MDISTKQLSILQDSLSKDILPVDKKAVKTKSSNKRKSTTAPRHDDFIKRPRIKITEPMQPLVGSEANYAQLHREVKKLFVYTHDRLMKFPKYERSGTGIASTLASIVDNTLRAVIQAYSYGFKPERERILRVIAVDMKMAQNLVDVSCHLRYITPSNRESWCRMLSTVDYFAIRIAMWEQKHPAKQVKVDNNEEHNS